MPVRPDEMSFLAGLLDDPAQYFPPSLALNVNVTNTGRIKRNLKIYKPQNIG